MTRSDLPTGTVTFLFTDIAGSTRLVAELGPATFRDVLELHHQLLRTAFSTHGGVERGTQGDSFLVIFREAPAAVAAAVAAQRALASADWPAGGPVHVRMGLHTGTGLLGGDDYVGIDVHRAARIAGAGHGGQVLLSDVTRALVDGALPAGTSVRRLGDHRLKDLGRPEVLHQLVIEGLAADFPPLRSESGRPEAIPARVTSFVGRDRELAELRTVLQTTRLVTLTGPGGTGKTSLAVELARDQSGRFPDGVWVVPLETVGDPDLVASTIAARIGLAPGGSPSDALFAFVEDRRMLLVLDNFEQVLPAAPLVADLLRAAPGLSVVITSRAPLHVSGEQDFPVPPLALEGDGRDDGDGVSITGSPAVELFLDRARRVRPGLHLADDDLAIVASICRRVDGLPLGIELAASRVGVMGLRDIARRLEARLDLPGVAPRDLPSRQQTLASTIEWSVELLDARARTLLGRLSVFAGGCHLAEAEAVCGPGTGDDVLDDLSTLVDHSLVRLDASSEGPRFRLLETIRMVAAGRLTASGDEAMIRRRHAETYLAIAEEAAPLLTRRGGARLVEMLEVEQDNHRAAIGWALDQGEPEIALRLVGALWRFWQLRGHLGEGVRATDAALAMPGADARTHSRVVALGAAGGVAWWRDQLGEADARYLEQVALAREIGDEAGLADGLLNLAHTTHVLDPGGAYVPILAEALERFERLGDEAAAARTRAVGAWFGLSADPDGAAATLEAVLPVLDAQGDDFNAALATIPLGWLALRRGDVAGAIRYGLSAQAYSIGIGDVSSMTLGLHEGAVFLMAMGDLEGASTLEAGYEHVAERHGIRAPGGMLLGPQDALAPQLTALRSDPTFDAARRMGATMSLEDGQEFLLERLQRRLDAHTETTGPRGAAVG